MPLYDYAPKSGKCRRCRGRFEVMQRIAAPKLKRCPTCRKPVERLISKVALGGKYSLCVGRRDQWDRAKLPGMIIRAQSAQQVVLVECAMRHQHIQHQLPNQACPDHCQQHCRADQDQELP